MEPLILIVDDREDDRRIMVSMLEGFGYRSLAISDGATALQLAQYWQPALILLDICMPGMDGYEVIYYLRQSLQTAAIPVIAVTAMGTSACQQCLAAGFDDYLMKPFTIEFLKQTIDRYLVNAMSYSSIQSCKLERA